MQSRDTKIGICYEILLNNSILVLATQGDSGPHTSLMTYACSRDGRNIYMVSSKSSHKWINMQKNPQVSLLIDDRDGKLADRRAEIKALTITGRFHEVSDPAEEKEIMKQIAGVNPAIASFFSGPQCGIVDIKVESFLLLDGPRDAFYSGVLDS